MVHIVYDIHVHPSGIAHGHIMQDGKVLYVTFLISLPPPFPSMDHVNVTKNTNNVHKGLSNAVDFDLIYLAS